MKHDMQLRVLDLLPDGRAYDIHLGFRIPKFAGKESQFVGFETFHYLEVVPGADFLLFKGGQVCVSGERDATYSLG